MEQKRKPNAYDRVLIAVFDKHWREGLEEVLFTKDDLIDEADRIGLRVKNIADILYTYRSRRPLPPELREKGNWVIAARSAGKYAFLAVKGNSTVEIPERLKVYPIPYAVPEIVANNLADDEQGLLTIVRYNRLLDVFTGLACFHLQSHVRTQIPKHGQVEIDDLYRGRGQGWPGVCAAGRGQGRRRVVGSGQSGCSDVVCQGQVSHVDLSPDRRCSRDSGEDRLRRVQASHGTGPGCGFGYSPLRVGSGSWLRKEPL